MSAAAAITEIVARLNLSKQSGGILHEWTVEVEPNEQALGRIDLPALCIYVPSISETTREKNLAVPSVKLSLVVLTDRKAANPLAEHAEAVNDVLDCIDLNRATPRVADPLLNNTLKEPFTATAAGSGAYELSLRTAITVDLKPLYVTRGARNTR